MSEILIDSELLSCPICADTFVDACDTGCGHTFCDFCLNSCLENRPDKCPVCSKDPSPVHPAFTIRAICGAVAPHVVEDPSMTVESEKELGNSSYYKNKYAQAILHYNNAINKCTHTDPKNSYLYNNRSQCFIHLRQFKRALDDCDEAIRLNDDNIKAYMRKGLCLRMLGHFEESRAAYNKATILDKGGEWKQQIQDGLRFLPASAPLPQQQSQQPQQQQPQQPQPQPQQQQQQQPRTTQPTYTAQPQPQQQYYFPYGQQYTSNYPQFNQNHARYQYPGHYTVRTNGIPNHTFHPNYQYHNMQQQQQAQQQAQQQQQQTQQPQPQPPQQPLQQPPQQQPPQPQVNTSTTNVNTTVQPTTTTTTTQPTSTSASSTSATSSSNLNNARTTSQQPLGSAPTTGKGRGRSSSGNCKSQ